ncbi:MAG: hypothetical protein WDZ40_01585 [Candidatus Spechtbacterales bacterium]
MNNFANRSYYGISLIVGVIFIAFSFMVQSWPLALTTIIFIFIQTLVKEAVEAREEQKAKEAVKAMEEGRESEDSESVIKIKLPIDLFLLVGFFVIAFIELALTVLLSF